MGPVKEVEKTFALYKKLGINACEIPFTYGVYIKDKKVAEHIGKLAKKNNISLSIHAPYYINLASKEKIKREASKKRIFDSCRIGYYLGVKYVVFHAAYYTGRSEEEIYKIVKDSILELQKKLKKEGFGSVSLCPETTGKESQFGSIEELVKLAKETKCGVCVDFAHIYARNVGKIDYDYVCKLVKKIKIKTGHFSGIEYGPKGERRHIHTDKKRVEELLKYLKKYKISIRLIDESPDPLKGALIIRSVLEGL